MFPFALCDRRFTLQRMTALILDSAAAQASVSLSRQPVRASRVQVHITGGSTATGSVTVVGTVDGTANQQESLAFDGPGTQVTRKQFTHVSSISTAGLTNEASVATVEAYAVDTAGSKQAQMVTYATDIPGILEENAAFGQWRNEVPGAEAAGSAKVTLPFLDAWAPRLGDLLIESALAFEQAENGWFVDSHPRPRGPLAGRFWELTVSRR